MTDGIGHINASLRMVDFKRLKRLKEQKSNELKKEKLSWEDFLIILTEENLK